KVTTTGSFMSIDLGSSGFSRRKVTLRSVVLRSVVLTGAASPILILASQPPSGFSHPPTETVTRRSKMPGHLTCASLEGALAEVCGGSELSGRFLCNPADFGSIGFAAAGFLSPSVEPADGFGGATPLGAGCIGPCAPEALGEAFAVSAGAEVLPST